MNSEKVILPNDMEHDIIMLFDDVYKNTNASELHNISDEGKIILIPMLISLFEGMSGTRMTVINNAVESILERDFIVILKKYLSAQDIKKFTNFTDGLAGLYQKTEISIDPNDTRFIYALTGIFIYTGLLPYNITSGSTSLHLESGNMIQEKIKDILVLYKP